MNIEYIDLEESKPFESFNNFSKDDAIVSIERAEELSKKLNSAVRIKDKHDKPALLKKANPIKTFMNKPSKVKRIKVNNIPEKAVFATLDDYLRYHGFK